MLFMCLFKNILVYNRCTYRLFIINGFYEYISIPMTCTRWSVWHTSSVIAFRNRASVSSYIISYVTFGNQVNNVVSSSPNSLFDTTVLVATSILTLCGRVTRLTFKDLRQIWIRYWLAPLMHQTITQSIIESWSVRVTGVIAMRFQWLCFHYIS